MLILDDLKTLDRSVTMTTSLWKKLHETLGDEAASEMVDWMRGVDQQRAELRELNELNYARIDARFGEIDARFREVDARLEKIDARFDTVDARFGQMEASIVGRLEAQIERRFSDLLKWSFVFWVGAVVSIAAMARLLPP